MSSSKSKKTLHYDDSDDIDYSDIVQKYEVDYPSGYDSVIVVDNLPIVNEAKEEKLIAAVKKIFVNFGTVKDGGVFMPMDPETGESKGYMFLDFETPEQADLAVKHGDGHKMTKTHILAVNKLDDIEACRSVPDEFQAPESAEYVEKEHLKSWLTDPRARDQWVVMRGDEVSIFWNNKSQDPELVYSRPNWSDMYLSWSPKGNYLATFHKQGIVLWGGPSWNKIIRFVHQNVKLIDFSPNEKYLVTWSNESFTTPTGELHNIIVWDIVSGLQLRTFAVDPASVASAERSQTGGSSFRIDWPVFKWSHDDKYLARMTPGVQGLISIYETPGMGLLDKKSIKIENLQGFAWCPNQNIISFWISESGNTPARVTVMSIPNREILRTKNLFNVTDCKMHWQSSGDYLLVKVDRMKTKKQSSTNFEIFRMAEKGIPVDVLEISNPNESITSINWEPNGSRFAVLSTEGQKIMAHFYEMQTIQAQAAAKKSNTAITAGSTASIKLLKSMERKGVNQIHWSPKGRYCVLAGIKLGNGDLEFWDVEDLVMMNHGEHYACTDVEWDPTGRFVATSVSWWRIQVDTGFVIWSFTGEQLNKQNMPVFKQLLWRPRPPTLLSKEQQKAIRKDLKSYSKDFEKDDVAQETEVNRDLLDRRIRMWNDWQSFRRRGQDEYRKQLRKRIEIYGFDPDVRNDDDAEDLEEWIEEVIEETEELVLDD
ncbi:eukaryotic translation initiation factor eIF2A-domain-containing protein [Polychytrium aggregatum]|uniref:eukaryotic translation initiation factor eIF2A-domain-containing protein n=1 Tax=Polychytrium aggregatum TaxID=110093 RepID=UPI0022FEEACA|nr:eukaryotic translation initiation factor eIF2A-domain-containing protein [Polychytrium aggregatum]KAI9209841.1 eukaryotic translation initiation factor eIF2A-domain-containing protein [Polychytrium aggregatum]